jgi:hypothetical protein
MATKSPKKPRKTTSKQPTEQSTSTVTSIGPGGNVENARNAGFASMDDRIEEEIRIRAYELFEERGRLEGNDREDWARAEIEVLARYRRDKSA